MTAQEPSLSPEPPPSRMEALRDTLFQTLAEEDFGTSGELRAPDPEPLPEAALADTESEDLRDDSFSPFLDTPHLEEAETRTESPARRYVITGRLGRGTSGQVFAVRDQLVEREVAVKVLHPADAANPKKQARFIREARITASLEHSNILPVHDLSVGSRTGDAYFTMRRVDGISLAEAIAPHGEPSPLCRLIETPNQCVNIVLKVGAALAYAHAQGVVHRDIKPQNIMINQFGEALLVDWGTAVKRDETTAHSQRLVGTPAYMAPEQARRERADAQSDIYALGATLVHMLTRRYPTWGESPEAFWRKKRCGVIDPPTPEEARGVPKRLLAIARKATAPEPAARYLSVDAFMADLAAFQEGLAVSAYRESWPERLHRFYCRHRPVARLTLGGVAVLLVVSAVLLHRAREAELEQLRTTVQLAQAEARARELKAEREASWQPVAAFDFTRGDTLGDAFVAEMGNVLMPDERLRNADEYVLVRDGLLTLRRSFQRLQLHWRTPIAEELRISLELRNDHNEGPNIGINICGDGRHGYRLRFYQYSFLALETVRTGTWEILQMADPAQIDRTSQTYRIVLQRAGHTISAWINDQRVIHYLDPLAPLGDPHRTFALSRYMRDGTADILKLRIQRRQESEWVDVLEPGRTLLRESLQPGVGSDYRRTSRQAARRWFARISEIHPGTILAPEADFLLPFTHVRGSAAWETGLQAVAARPENLYAARASQMLARHYLQADRASEALRAMEAHLSLAGTEGRVEEFFFDLQDRMGDWPAATRRAALQGVAELDVPVLRFPFCQIEDLAPLRPMKLTALSVRGNPLHDLSPLRDMSLTELDLGLCPDVVDLAPLAGMPLETLLLEGSGAKDFAVLRNLPLARLNASDTALRELALLRNLPLIDLAVAGNEVGSLRALRGQALQKLNVAYNRITDLSPLNGMPLRHLRLDGNPVQDLSPLSGMPLRFLSFRKAQVASLTPLTGMPLQTLDCGENRITDLSPLSGMPLRNLWLSRNRVTDLEPLQNLPLFELSIANTPVRDLASLAALPLSKLNCSDTQVEDLSPLAATRIKHLYCNRVPVTDLRPLAPLPLSTLLLRGLPPDATGLEAVTGATLDRLEVTLTPKTLSWAAGLPSLASFNQHRRNHTVAIGPRLLKALAAWRRAPARTCPPTLDLRPAAVRVGRERVLALPVFLTRREAEAFAVWQGGYLATPGDLTRSAPVTDYLKQVIAKRDRTVYHCGLGLTSDGEGLRVAAGDVPVLTPQRRDDLLAALREGQNIACTYDPYQSTTTLHGASRELRACVLLAWPRRRQ